MPCEKYIKHNICSSGNKGFKTCEKEHRKCEHKDGSPSYHCTDCKEGYVLLKGWLWSDECVEHCSSRTPSASECAKLKKNCYVTKKKPFYECRCKDNLTEKNGKCVEYCSTGTESKKDCTKKNRLCKKLSEKPYFNCGECEKKFEEVNKECVDFCTNGAQSEKNCSALNKVCKSYSKEPYFQCAECKVGYEKIGDSCIEHCDNGTTSEKNCSAQNKICQKTDNKPFFSCGGCLKGYVLKDDKCIKYCDNGTEDHIQCFNQNKECHVTKVKPFYKCEDCMDGFTKRGKECVEYCTIDTASEEKCTSANKICQVQEVSPFFNCGNCKDQFVELDNTCVTECSSGTESEKYCTAQNRTCEIKEQLPFYSCGECKLGFIEIDKKCLDHCIEGQRGYVACQRKNRICKRTEVGLFYNCTECIFGYILKDNYCLDPCDEEGEGRDNCSALGRECIFHPGKEYKCGACSSSNWTEDGERCIDPCERIFPSEENTTWSEVCENANGSCKYDYNFNRTSCVCHEKDNVFSLESKSCHNPCDHAFPNDETATWSEVCEKANAICKHDQKLNETSCICHEENNLFNVSSKSCLNPCIIERDGVIWSDLCRETNAKCIFRKDKRDVTCECTQPEELFDNHSKTCKDLCDHVFSDDGSKTWSQVCQMGNAVCEYNVSNVNCRCLEEYAVFNMTTKSCIKLHPCDLSMDMYPCKNNGTCKSIDEEKYECICTSGWYGTHCEHRNLCNEELCYPALCLMNKVYHNYLCVCSHDEYFNYEKKSCEKIACLGKTCPPLQECQDGNCVCKQGFKEENKECKITDEECEKHCGKKHVNCVNVSSPTDFTCICKEGYYFNPSSFSCEVARCVFPFHPCEQKCNIDGDQLCSCFDGFQLANNYSCEVQPENSCNESICKNGKCMKKDGKEVCVCDNGFMESNDSQCIDICEISGHEMVQSLCPDGCIHKNGSIKCICTGKYIQASDGISCIERDYCEEGDIGQIECMRKGKICIKQNQDPWYRCVCPKGFRDENSENCTDSCSREKINECAETHRICKYVNDIEECHCPLSMMFDKKSKRCLFANNFFYVTIDVRIKQAGTNIMYTLSDKEHFRNSFFDSMKVLYGPSLLDTDVIECTAKASIQTCTFSIIFEKNADEIKNRLKNEQSCKPLQNTTEYCIFPPDLIVNKNSLETASFSSNKCDKKMRKKFCPIDSNICTLLAPGYSCHCKPEFTPVSSFILGNDQRYTYETCEDIDECKSDPCWKNSKCQNTYGSFYCHCDRGYILNDTKNGCQGVCDDNPCGSNGKCKLFGDHGYKCECNEGYKGETCMEKNIFHKQYNLYIIIVGVVLGCMLLLSTSVIILLIIKVYRLFHDSYDMQMSYDINKYEQHPLSLVKENIKKERTGFQAT